MDEISSELTDINIIFGCPKVNFYCSNKMSTPEILQKVKDCLVIGIDNIESHRYDIILHIDVLSRIVNVF